MARAVASAALAAQLLFAASAWECGVGHPDHGHLFADEPAVVAQSYVDAPQRRQLQTSQAYDDSLSFMAIADADKLGLTGRLRVKVLWDVVASGDTAGTPQTTFQCNAAGATINLASTAASYDAWSGCTAAHVPAGARLDTMKKRTNDAVAFWSGALRVKPVKDPITIAPGVLNMFQLSGTPPQSDADLVLIMTARPSRSPIAGYAKCVQEDQRGRCTVGQFNWIPSAMQPDAQSDYAVTETEMHTALHELVHVLGGIIPSSKFLNATGALLGASSIYRVEDDPAYAATPGKKRTIVTTPKVANLTRFYYSCPTAAGLPLEDIPLGKGSHWEARVMGPEVMAYGSGSGQIYLSDLTLAFLEDTGHYVADYSKAGYIVSPAYDSYSGAGVALKDATNKATNYVPPPPLAPGAPRWGYKGGCSFLEGNPRSVAPWTTQLTCAVNNDYGCTNDNRMSAVCVVKSTWTSVDAAPNCGVYSGNTATCTSVAGDVAGKIPSWARPYATDAAAVAASGEATATAASTGGYNDALDWLPIQTGWSNCAFSAPASNVTQSSSYVSTLSSLASQFTSGSADMTKMGGQSHCPTCRCMKSSLMEMSRLAVDLKFPRYGLCYRTNCARSDYLQIAVLGQWGAKPYWYRCPKAGGKLYIPGFTGSLQCPPSEQFCAMESVSGVAYPEQNPLFEIIFWGAVVGLFLIFFVLGSCPCLRDKCINCSKACCGARAFEPPGGFQEEGLHGEPPPPLPKIEAWTLFIVSLLTLCAGAAIIGVIGYFMGTTAIYNASINVLGVGCLIFLLSVVGCCASRKRAVHGPSCWALSYLFCDFCVIVLLIWVIAWQLGLSNWKSLVANNLEFLAAVLKVPASVPAADLQAYITNQLSGFINAIMGVAIGVCVILAIALVAVIRLMQARVAVAFSMGAINSLLICFGLLLVAAASYLLAQGPSTIGGFAEVSGYAIGLGLAYVVVSSLGLSGVRRKSTLLMAVFMVLELGMIGAASAGVWLCFSRADLVSSWLAAQSDDSLAAVTQALGYSTDQQTLQQNLQANLQQIGLALCCILLLQVWVVIAAALFLWAVHVWRLENGLALSGAKSLGARLSGGGMGLPPVPISAIAPARNSKNSARSPRPPPVGAPASYAPSRGGSAGGSIQYANPTAPAYYAASPVQARRGAPSSVSVRY